MLNVESDIDTIGGERKGCRLLYISVCTDIYVTWDIPAQKFLIYPKCEDYVASWKLCDNDRDM